MAHTTFQDVLEEKMRRADKPAPPLPARDIGATDPAHLAFLLGHVEVFRFRPSAPATKKTAPAPRPSRPHGPAHPLDERQCDARAWFLRFGETLPPDFTATELKTAFRRLALRLHPDVAGTGPTAFLELKTHHTALRRVFQGSP